MTGHRLTQGHSRSAGYQPLEPPAASTSCLHCFGFGGVEIPRLAGAPKGASQWLPDGGFYSQHKKKIMEGKQKSPPLIEIEVHEAIGAAAAATGTNEEESVTTRTSFHRSQTPRSKKRRK